MAQRQQPIRVGIVDEEFPYPANSGKRLRTLNLIQRLAKTHELTYVAHQNSKPGESKVARDYLESIGVKTVEVDRVVPPKSGVAFYSRLFANLFSKLPYSVTSHVSEKMKAVLAQVEQESDIQLWHCEWTPYAELFRGWDTRPVVMAAHNVESLIWQRYIESETNMAKRWYIRHQWKKFVQFERWAFGRVTRTIAVSRPDQQLAVEDFGAENVVVVDNGVDSRKYIASGQRSTNTMIFLGSLDWRPNLDGLQHFIRNAYPKIVQARPDVVFQIVGRNPAKWLVELAEMDPNIELHADVPLSLIHI